jgi:hypothetical protein
MDGSLGLYVSGAEAALGPDTGILYGDLPDYYGSYGADLGVTPGYSFNPATGRVEPNPVVDLGEISIPPEEQDPFDFSNVELPRDWVESVEQNLVRNPETGRLEPSESPTMESLYDTLYENLVGVGEADTFGERLGQGINDLGTQFVSGVATTAANTVSTLGNIANYLSDGGTKSIEMDTDPVTGETFFREVTGPVTGNPLQSVYDELMQFSQDFKAENLSETAKAALRGTVISGDIFNPSAGISLGDDPSMFGLILQVAEVVPSLLGPLAVSRYSTIAGMGTAGVIAAGDLEQDARTYMRELASSGQMQNLPAYQELIDQGFSPAEAAQALENNASQWAATVGAPIAALAGGAFNKVASTTFTRGLLSKGLVDGTLAKGANIAGKAAAGSAIESVTEVLENTSAKLATNLGVGTDRNITENSFREAVLGAMGGLTASVGGSGAVPVDPGTGAPPAPYTALSSINNPLLDQADKSRVQTLLDTSGPAASAGTGLTFNQDTGQYEEVTRGLDLIGDYVRQGDGTFDLLFPDTETARNVADDLGISTAGLSGDQIAKSIADKFGAAGGNIGPGEALLGTTEPVTGEAGAGTTGAGTPSTGAGTPSTGATGAGTPSTGTETLFAEPDLGLGDPLSDPAFTWAADLVSEVDQLGTVSDITLQRLNADPAISNTAVASELNALGIPATVDPTTGRVVLGTGTAQPTADTTGIGTLPGASVVTGAPLPAEVVMDSVGNTVVLTNTTTGESRTVQKDASVAQEVEALANNQPSPSGATSTFTTTGTGTGTDTTGTTTTGTTTGTTTTGTTTGTTGTTTTGTTGTTTGPTTDDTTGPGDESVTGPATEPGAGTPTTPPPPGDSGGTPPGAPPEEPAGTPPGTPSGTPPEEPPEETPETPETPEVPDITGEAVPDYTGTQAPSPMTGRMRPVIGPRYVPVPTGGYYQYSPELVGGVSTFELLYPGGYGAPVPSAPNYAAAPPPDRVVFATPPVPEQNYYVQQGIGSVTPEQVLELQRRLGYIR